MRFAMLAVLALGCGRLQFDELPDGGSDAAPIPLACGESRVLGSTSYPGPTGDREISAATTDEGGVVVWNTSDARLVGVGLTLTDDVGIHGFGMELAAAPVLAVGVAAIGNSVLTAGGDDSQAGSTRVQLWSSRLAPRAPAVTLPISVQERNAAFSTPRGELGVTGVEGGLPAVQYVSRTGAAGSIMMFQTASQVSETVGVGTQTGVLTATTTDLADGCILRDLRPDLSETGQAGLETNQLCDNPRLAYDPASDRFLFVYARGGVRVQADRASGGFTTTPTRLVAATGASATAVWDGVQYWLVYRVGPEPAALVAHPLDLAGLDVAPPQTVASGLAERAYTAFVFRAQTYAVWTGVDLVMRLTRVCR